MKSHRSSILDGRILHHDVFEWNIIITDADKSGGLFGSLIDLELDAVVDNGRNTRTGLQRVTDTLKLMAIEVLELGMTVASAVQEPADG